VGVKVYPHRLRHTAATQLLNAGCRVTSIQKFLGHKELSTTMVYARVHDQTVADDYYAAMSQIEKRLDLLDTQQGVSIPISNNERTQLLALTTQLEQPELNLETRLSIVTQMREVLTYSKIDQDTYSLPSPILVKARVTSI
jgi:Phage integrase family